MEITLTQDQIESYNRLYEKGLKLIRPNIFIDGEPQSGRPGWIAKRRLRKGIADFQEALLIAPFAWECRFWIGKALQRLGSHEEAMSWFVDAIKQEPTNTSIAKEAANEALELAQYQLGIAFLRPAVVAKPSDPVLHYDLAIHQLLAGNVDDAYHSLRKSAALESHRMTGRLLRYVEDVRAGRKSRPRTVAEVQRGG
jgi:tetratricopeptide (TPR) repeat protein